MKTYKNLYQTLCSKENIESAFKKARKGKSQKPYVLAFEANLEENLNRLRTELLLRSYTPRPLKTFVVRDPKTRKIRKSYFVDRIVHHAICNIIEPIFEKRFIFDSFANRKGKGTLAAINRFDKFKLKASKNNIRTCYVFKADIRHYFDEIDHNMLLAILGKRINDNDLMHLIRKVLNNHSDNVGMPLGNMTSQFFANVYLNELDHYVKHQLKARYYLRYVDDFVILSHNKQLLQDYKNKIESFLESKLRLHLHPDKSKIIRSDKGIGFLGFRHYKHHRLLRKANIRLIKKNLLSGTYDSICTKLEGWIAYAKQASTYKLRKRLTDIIEANFRGFTSLLQIDRLTHYFT